MRTESRHTEGYNNLIQCQEISSSTDLYHFLSKPRDVFPVGRRSYRHPLLIFNNPHLRLHLNIMNSNNPVQPDTRQNALNNISTRWAMLAVGGIFLSALCALFLVYANFPKLKEDERIHVKLPWNIEEAKQLAIVLDRYRGDHYYQVLSGVFVTYIFLQTFAIPGSLFLSILSGFLFPFVQALILVCTCSAIGASLCFLLSQLLGRRLVLKYLPERASKWAVIVEKHRDNLLNYMIFLRITPFLPNWFINLTAPVIGVPLWPFALGTFIGVAPPSFVAIQAGQTLYTMSGDDSTFSWTSFVMLGIFAILSLIPIFLKQKFKQKFE